VLAWLDESVVELVVVSKYLLLFPPGCVEASVYVFVLALLSVDADDEDVPDVEVYELSVLVYDVVSALVEVVPDDVVVVWPEVEV
jgi:hypothetical protein